MGNCGDENHNNSILNKMNESVMEKNYLRRMSYENR